MGRCCLLDEPAPGLAPFTFMADNWALGSHGSRVVDWHIIVIRERVPGIIDRFIVGAFMPSDREWMERAVDQARLSQGEPGRISPKVGAVVVNKDGEFLAQAHRGEDHDHKDHAEFYALEKKLGSETLADATVFTTLEPCFERSEAKTACARRLVARRVNRVVIGMLDPDPSVHGKGQLFLLDNRIDVQNFPADLTRVIMDLNREFIRDRSTSRFIIVSPSHNAKYPGDI